jgi:hypothetical protein
VDELPRDARPEVCLIESRFAQPQIEARGPIGVRMRGLNRACDSIQRQFEAASGTSGMDQAHALRSMGDEILFVLEAVGMACDRADIDPHEFPLPARRAFAWLGRLAAPEYRRAHLEALQAAAAVDARVRTRFYNSTVLYRLSPRTGVIHLTAHEAFVGAPRDVLRSLVRLGVPHSRKRVHRARVTTHAETPEFRLALGELERFDRPAEDAGRGRHFDLMAVFARVNCAYFEGRMSPPHLAWSRSVLRREFGRYESSRDTVTLNRALDHPDVPERVVEYVLYHELLHKELGVRVRAGRREVHTRAFREAERRFVHRSEAEACLRRLGEGLQHD